MSWDAELHFVFSGRACSARNINRCSDSGIDSIAFGQLGASGPLYQLDIDENRDTTNDERVNGTPTFVVYKNGKEMWRWSGKIEGNTLLAKI